jgi:hypothetical protein
MRFSKAFKLKKVQAELDFVDIDPTRDTRLFVDPYAIQIKDNEFSTTCADGIKTYFAEVLESLRRSDLSRAEYLTSYLSEPQETFLGLSRGRPQGRGVGRFQANQLLSALIRSKAFQTGVLSDLAEAELFVEGIARDKVSDLTTNILRGPLINYTQHQCELHSIPLSREVPSGPIWDPSHLGWIHEYVKLPVISGKPIMLVPKYFVRRSLSLESQEFYNHYVLEYLREENLAAMSSLVQFFKRSGEPYVTKKSLKEKYPMVKDDLAIFARDHPEVLETYRKIAGAKGTLDADEFDDTFDEKAFALALMERLGQIPGGMQSASLYHSFTMGILTFLFFPELINPIKEYELHLGRKRVDIKFTNAGEKGFFRRMLVQPQTRSIQVLVECKNYTRALGNPEIDQLAGRFGHTRGYFGMLLCREVDDWNTLRARCRDTALDGRGFIVVLDDRLVTKMLLHISMGERGRIDRVLASEFEQNTK